MQKPITKQQVEEMQNQKRAVKLIDIRPPEEYEKMHVPGSLNIPASTIAENSTEFGKDDTIVCICTKGLERSQNAAETFSAMGFANVFYLEDGAVGWLANNTHKNNDQ
jgi:rhodanese-related sulfurtransferase